MSFEVKDDFFLRMTHFAWFLSEFGFMRSTISYKNRAGVVLREGLGLQEGESSRENPSSGNPYTDHGTSKH
jgi:hypothetical protein